jgi:DNA end-binding protein Ku
MATQLIESMTKKWQPDDYKDEFRAQLRKIIDEQVARQKGKKVREPKEAEAEPAEATTNVVDFMELLKRSLEKDGKKTGGRSAAPSLHARRRRESGAVVAPRAAKRLRDRYFLRRSSVTRLRLHSARLREESYSTADSECVLRHSSCQRTIR